MDGVSLEKEGLVHKLVISKVEDIHAGKYRFEAGDIKTEASIFVEGESVQTTHAFNAQCWPCSVRYVIGSLRTYSWLLGFHCHYYLYGRCYKLIHKNITMEPL